MYRRLPNYRLTYFDLKGRGESIRLIFAYTQIPYEETRVKFEDFPALKPTLPFGTLPLLYVDDEVLVQSTAICGYLGKKFGLNGENDLEVAKCYMIAGGMEDMNQLVGFGFSEKSPEQIEANFVPFFERFERLLETNGSEFFVGNKLTWVDFVIFNSVDVTAGMARPESNVMDRFPLLTEFQERMAALPNVKEWLETRPKWKF